MTVQQPKKHNYRNPVARQLKEDRAFRLKVRDDKRRAPTERVSVREATILLEEERNNEGT